MPVESVNSMTGDSVRAAAAALDRHGVQRRGVRALIANASETSRSSLGKRRFAVTVAEGTSVLYHVDPQTQLLEREEWTTPSGSTDVRYSWRRSGSGYRKKRTDVTYTESLNGRPIVSRSTVTVTNLHLNGVLVP